MGRKIRMSDLGGEADRRWAKRFDEAERELVESKHGREAIADNRDLDASAARKARIAAAKARRRAREFDPEVARDYRRPTR
jgi:hypothetical protein